MKIVGGPGIPYLMLSFWSNQIPQAGKQRQSILGLVLLYIATWSVQAKLYLYEWVIVLFESRVSIITACLWKTNLFFWHCPWDMKLYLNWNLNLVKTTVNSHGAKVFTKLSFWHFFNCFGSVSCFYSMLDSESRSR